jgi:hypothetical protein
MPLTPLVAAAPTTSPVLVQSLELDQIAFDYEVRVQILRSVYMFDKVYQVQL